MSNTKLVKSENFGSIQCDFWQDDKQNALMTREQIGRALEYKNPQKAIDNLHSKYRERLDKFSVTLKLRGTDGKEYDTCVYFPKGVYEICRWSRQPKANGFMDWAWETIEEIRKLSSADKVFRMLDKGHQIEAMNHLKLNLSQPVKVDYIKANTVANKTVSTMYGYPKMLKKDAMTPEMLVQRQEVLEETVNLMGVNEKFNLDLSISKTVKGKYLNQNMLTN